MKYLMLIYSNDETWAALSASDRGDLGAGHARVRSELMASGRYADGAGLADETLTRTVRVRDGAAVATDGPYVEAKEHLAGFYVVECDTHHDAVAVAARLPDAAVNFVEVRPVGP